MSGHHPQGGRTLHRRQSNSHRGRRAAAAVELAVVLPLLLTLLLFGADFGRVIHERIAVANAARMGAEYAAGHPYRPNDVAAWEEEVHQAVLDELANTSSVDPSMVNTDIVIDDEGNQSYSATVEVSLPFRTIVDWPATPSEVLLRTEFKWRRYR